MSGDREQLNLLSTFLWIRAAIVALFSLFPILHPVLGLELVRGDFTPDKDDDPYAVEFMGWFFVVFSMLWIVLDLVFASCLALSAGHLKAGPSACSA